MKTKQAAKVAELKNAGFRCVEKRLQQGGYFHYIMENRNGAKFRVTTTGAVKDL